MDAGVGALALIVAVLQIQTPSPDGPRGLYTQAAALIAAGEPQAAIEPLEDLLAAQPAPALAGPSVLALAECYLASGQYQPAYELLCGETAKSLEAAERQHAAQLKCEAARRAALECEREGCLVPAVNWLEHAMHASAQEIGSEAARKILQEEFLRVGLRACAEDLSRHEGTLDFLASLTTEHRRTLRLALAERLYARGEWLAALDQWESLASEIESDGEPPPDWSPSLALRCGEIYLKTRQYARGRQVLERARRSFPNFEYVSEFNFLLARCAIAQIDFEAAVEYLLAIVELPAGSGPMQAEYRARAQWMIGEVHFLQERYSQAIAAYQAVPRFGAEAWTRRAQLQQAKCEELMGRQAEALRSYARIVDEFAQTEEADFATQRLAQIRAATQFTGIRN